MRKMLVVIGVALIYLFPLSPPLFGGDNDQNNNKPAYVLVGDQSSSGQTPFPQNERMHRIYKQEKVLAEAYTLSSQGLFDDAIAKYQESLDSPLLNDESDKAGGLWGLMRVYQRQGRYKEALEKLGWFLQANPSKSVYQDKQLELLALLQSQQSDSSKPVYDHIAYLRKKYQSQLPPNGKWTDISSMAVNDIIHLYDALGDVWGGIQFMDEVISYRKKNGKKFDERRTAEYERVKAAFEEDKRTGQKGHLQKVIETSDYIGW